MFYKKIKIWQIFLMLIFLISPFFIIQANQPRLIDMGDDSADIFHFISKVGINTSDFSGDEEEVRFKIENGRLLISDDAELCFSADCRSEWPSGGGGHWKMQGAKLYPNNISIWKVGIGTNQPETTLDVGGFLNVDDGIILKWLENDVGRMLTVGEEGFIVASDIPTLNGDISITDINASAWKVFYSNAQGDIVELGLGANGQVLTSQGSSAIPTWQTISPGGDFEGYWSLSGNNLYPNELNYNIGIGVDNPLAKLDLDGNLLARSLVTIESLIGEGIRMVTVDEDGTLSYDDIPEGGGTMEEVDPTWEGEANLTSHITRTGRVGLGSGTDNAPSYTFKDLSNVGMFLSDNNLSFSTNGIERMSILNDGNIDINRSLFITSDLRIVSLAEHGNRALAVDEDGTVYSAPLPVQAGSSSASAVAYAGLNPGPDLRKGRFYGGNPAPSSVEKTLNFEGIFRASDLCVGTNCLSEPSVDWNTITNFPEPCPQGQFVMAIGQELICAADDGSKWAEGFEGDVLTPKSVNKIAVNESVVTERFAASINGSAAAPAFTFVEDLDTGMFRVDDSQLGFSVSGNNVLTLVSGSEQALDVNGNIRLSGDNRSIGTYSNHHLFLKTNNTTKMIIASDGNVGIGMAPATEHKLVVNGSVGATAFEYTSDINYKKDVKALDNSLSKILSLRGVDFVWKENDQKSIGLIAQELEEVFPELVSGSDGSKRVNYGVLVAPLIEAIKEQQEIINDLQLRLDRLEK
jgi:hypothetical protein